MIINIFFKKLFFGLLLVPIFVGIIGLVSNTVFAQTTPAFNYSLSGGDVSMQPGGTVTNNITATFSSGIMTYTGFCELVGKNNSPSCVSQNSPYISSETYPYYQLSEAMAEFADIACDSNSWTTTTTSHDASFTCTVTAGSKLVNLSIIEILNSSGVNILGNLQNQISFGSFNPSAITPTETSILTLNVGGSVPTGTYTAKVKSDVYAGGCPGSWTRRDNDSDGPNGSKDYCMATTPAQNLACPGYWQYRNDNDGPNGPKYYCMATPLENKVCPGNWAYRDDNDGPNGPKYYCMASGAGTSSDYIRTATFNIMVGYPPPSNITVTTNQCAITVSWTAPNNTDYIGFNIYRSGTTLPIATLPLSAGTTYTDTPPTAGISYTYSVTAAYVGGESAPAVAASITAVSCASALPPDLIAGAITPTSVLPGESTTFRSTLKNQGTVSTKTNSYVFTPTFANGYLEISVGGGSYTNFSIDNVRVALSPTSPNLITSFTNGSSYPYDAPNGTKTLTTSSNNISSAIETRGNVGGAVSNFLSLTTGQQYTLTYTLTQNSGTAPDIRLVSSAGGRSNHTSPQNSGLNITAQTGIFPYFFQKALDINGNSPTDLNTSPAYKTTTTALDAGATYNADSFPVSLSAGTYYLRACADKSSATGGGVINESNEGNNCGDSWTAVVVNSPTLSASLNADPSSGMAPLNGVSLNVPSVGGTASGDITYEFKCKDNDSWSSPQISNTYSSPCSYSSANTYTASARVTRYGITATPTATITVTNNSTSAPDAKLMIAKTENDIPFNCRDGSCPGYDYLRVKKGNTFVLKWIINFPGQSGSYQIVTKPYVDAWKNIGNNIVVTGSHQGIIGDLLTSSVDPRKYTFTLQHTPTLFAPPPDQTRSNNIWKVANAAQLWNDIDTVTLELYTSDDGVCDNTTYYGCSPSNSFICSRQTRPSIVTWTCSSEQSTCVNPSPTCSKQKGPGFIED